MALFLRALLASVALSNLVPSAWAQEPPKPGKQHDHLKRMVGSEAPAYEAYAVRFATCRDCPLTNLVKEADPGRAIDLAMTLWVLKDPGGRTVLVDAGFYRQEVLKYFGVADFTRPDKALERLGIKPDEVTDVILTHMHSDHVDGADLFPKAQS